MSQKTLLKSVAAIAFALTSTLLLAGGAYADIGVATSGAFTAAYLELRPELERVTGDKVVTAATSIGAGADSIPSRLHRGEPIDVVIVSDDVLDELIEAGLVEADSRVDLARSSIGVAVREGTPKPDIGSAAALKQALLNAKSIAYSGSVSGQYVSTELFQLLGIAEQVAAKSRRIVGERVGAVVARGEAEIGFQQISELLPIPGLTFVGSLPAELQRTTVFCAGVVKTSRQPQAARALIRFLASPEAASTVAKTGLELIHGH
jgi:molybdate transport system substrate-binding protein